MRQGLHSQETYAKRCTRIKTRSAVVLALATVGLAAGGIAYASHTTNTSSLTVNFAPSTAPQTTYVNGQLTFQTHTNYAHPGDRTQGGFTRTLTLAFDDDFKLTPGTIPQCVHPFEKEPKATLARAWVICGPGAGPDFNAYLSPPTGVSGRASTAPPSNFNGCVLAFKGEPTPASVPTIVLFIRVTTVVNGTADCSNPATNTKGNTTVSLRGTLEPAGIFGYGMKLVFNPDNLPLPLDDLKVTLKRSGFVKGRCFDAEQPWRLRGLFQYSGTGQADDYVLARQTCTVG